MLSKQLRAAQGQCEALRDELDYARAEQVWLGGYDLKHPVANVHGLILQHSKRHVRLICNNSRQGRHEGRLEHSWTLNPHVSSHGTSSGCTKGVIVSCTYPSTAVSSVSEVC